MSWRKIAMKFSGTCIVCNEKIEVNELGMWAKGIGVKHEKCSPAKELRCIICDGPAGCPRCEFQDNCNIEKVSQFCVCEKCCKDKDAFDLYQQSVNKKFSLLNLSSS